MRKFIVPLIIVVVFLSGWAFGSMFANADLARVSRTLRYSQLSAESLLIEQELLELGASCKVLEKRLNELGRELWQIGQRIESETAERDLGEENYRLLKRQYHTMQARAYIMFHKLLTECDQPTNVVLFFYSRQQQASAEQGKILDELVDKNPVNVLAIEKGYAPELAFLEQYYNINTTPSIIVNYDTILRGKANLAQIEESL